jgi:hypothetical protein
MPNATQIPAPRVPIIDSATGLMSREWFRYFSSVYEQLNVGVSGTFTSLDGKTITVTNGVITEIT